MLRSLSLAVALGLPAVAHAHAVFPGSQTVQTVSDRAFARFQAANGRADVAEFVVEIFDMDWAPSRLAIASPTRLRVPYQEKGATESTDKPFSVLISLGGKSEQRLRVCTKSVAPARTARLLVTRLNTRVCALVVVRRFQ